MGVLPFRRKKTDDSGQELYTLLQLAKDGDEDARNQLIESYVPFVLRTASQASKRYIDRTRDDEFSIALLAMNEAIDRFDLERKVSFIGFAETIIRRRLIDYFRTQKSHQRQVPWTEFDVLDDEDNATNFVEVQSSVDAFARSEERRSRAEEIAEYAKQLTAFELTFTDLVDLSPKHADARKSAIEVARLIANDPTMRAYVFERKSLPLKMLEDVADVSRKTMERQRKYILAVVVLLCGDFDFLRSYIT